MCLSRRRHNGRGPIPAVDQNLLGRARPRRPTKTADPMFPADTPSSSRTVDHIPPGTFRESEIAEDKQVLAHWCYMRPHQSSRPASTVVNPGAHGQGGNPLDSLPQTKSDPVHTTHLGPKNRNTQDQPMPAPGSGRHRGTPSPRPETQTQTQTRSRISTPLLAYPLLRRDVTMCYPATAFCHCSRSDTPVKIARGATAASGETRTCAESAVGSRRPSGLGSY